MQKSTLVSAALIAMTAITAHAAVVDVAGASKTGITLSDDGIANKLPTLRIRAQVAKLDVQEVKTEKGTFTSLNIPGGQISGPLGAPGIPVMTKLIEVPFGAKLSVKVVDRKVSKMSLQAKAGFSHPLMPRQPSHPKNNTVVPFAYDAQAYAAPGVQQEELARIEEVGVMRDRRLAMVTIAPVSYAPKSGEIEVFNDVVVEVALDGADLEKTAQVKKTYGSKYMDWAARETLVPASLQKMERVDHPSSLLIIADRKFEGELKSFIEWKTQKGFIVTTSYTDKVGATSAAVKTHIANLYANATAEVPAPDFVLFVADNEQIPAFRGTSGSHITDLPFVCVAGNDGIPDIFTGRFSAQTVEQLRPQIEKTLYYEKGQFADSSWTKSVVMVAGWDYSNAIEWGWPQIKYGVKYYFNAAHGLTDVSSFLSAGSSEHESDIIAKVSAGATYVNYTAHGSETSWADPAFEISDINALKNAGKYPLVVGNCCLTNSFQVGTCFGEAWLRADKKGAIGYIGGTNSTYWDEDLWWGNGNYPIQHPNATGEAPTQDETGVGAYEGMFDGNYNTNGAMVLCGNLAVQESTSPRKVYYWEIYSLMGDPSLRVFWGTPSESTVTHTATATAGATSLDVAAPAGATVGVSANGQYLGSATVAANGKATVATKALPAGTINVVVTGKNLKPYIGTVTAN